jgi:hypothetical protein
MTVMTNNNRNERGKIMNDREEMARLYALNWLNKLGGELLTESYFTGVKTLYSVEDALGIDALFEFQSDDDGSDARMFAHFDDGKITFAAWYFDTTWGEMTIPTAFEYQGLHDDCEIEEPHNHRGGE